MQNLPTATKPYGALMSGERFRSGGGVYADAVRGGGWRVAEIREGLIIGYDLVDPKDITSDPNMGVGIALPYSAPVEVPV